jgi:HK97 gp10 family phage protein
METIKGLDEYLAKLQKLETKESKKMMRKAVSAALRAMQAKAKAMVPMRTGELKKSISFKIKDYKAALKNGNNGLLYGIMGPKNKKVFINGMPVNPAKYSHLVEGGRNNDKVKNAKVMSDGDHIFGKRVKDVQARPFIEPAEKQTDVQSVMASKLQEEFEKL